MKPPEVGANSILSGIVEMAPGDLTPWQGNARVHPERQLIQLKAAIQEFGFTTPVLIDETKTILSGHGRVQAAMQLGLATVPTRLISGLTKARKRALVLADNKLGELSKWDEVQLLEEVQFLVEQDYPMETIGFTTAEIDFMLDKPPTVDQPDSDDLHPEDVPEQFISRLGDLWQLGDHLLLCGNALDPTGYDLLMRGRQAQMAITDPPYNTRIADISGRGKIQHPEFAMASGEMSKREFIGFLYVAMTNVHHYVQDGAINYIFIDWRHGCQLQAAADPIFGPPCQMCVWVKSNGGLGTFYRSQHELVYLYKKGTAIHINNFELGQHGRYRTNVWRYPGANSFGGSSRELLKLHPTVKPVSMIADAMRDCSHRKGLVLDPFAGSGTVLIAAERTGRHARAMELEPRYVDISIMRWQRVTGKQAVLTSTGQTWDEVRLARTTQQLEGENHGI